MRLVEYLSTLEKDMIQHYIESYAFRGDGHHHMAASVDHVLRYWDDAKSSYLFRMFGNQLILSKDIEYLKDESELLDEMWHAAYGDYSSVFCRKLLDLTDDWYGRSAEYRTLYHSVRDLIATESLVRNTYEGATFSIPTPDGKEVKINQGCKIIRALGKIATAFNIDGFEEFRIKHSMVLNQKTLKGKLSISIHPLDYMTMSDNECDWESCMSWKNNGCYRQGTAEMMNSSKVVVAYLTAAEDMKLTYRFNEENWNNKKWRELFIVTPEIITNVKPYPYTNRTLTTTVLDWLRELATAAQVGKYTENVEAWEYDYQGSNKYLCDKQLLFSFDTGYMYNDFESDHTNYSYFGEEYSDTTIFINYSGTSECMSCGATDIDVDGDEGVLVCDCCEGFTRCDFCDVRIYDGDEIYTVEGVKLCSSCYENRAFEDAYDNEVYLYENGCYEIFLGLSQKWADKIKIPQTGFWRGDEVIVRKGSPAAYTNRYVIVNNDNVDDALLEWSTDTSKVVIVHRHYGRPACVIPMDYITDSFARAIGYENVAEVVAQYDDKDPESVHGRMLI